MAERDFVRKLEKAGFEQIEVVARDPWGIEECALYPLFDEDLIALMRRLIREEDQQHVGDSIVIRACLGGEISRESAATQRRGVLDLTVGAVHANQ